MKQLLHILQIKKVINKIVEGYPVLAYGIIMMLFYIALVIIFWDRDYLLGYATLELQEWKPMKLVAFPSLWPFWAPERIIGHYSGIVREVIATFFTLLSGLVCCYLVDVLSHRYRFLRTGVRIIIKILIAGFAFPTICLWILATLHDVVVMFGPRIKATSDQWVIIFSVIYLLCVILSTMYFLMRPRIANKGAVRDI